MKCNVRHWIFLRGLIRGAGHWGDFVEKFKQRFPNDQVELIDLPGNGFRYQEKSPIKISDYVQDIRSRSQFIQQGHKVNLLALSLGGMIATKWNEMYPQDLEQTYLVCTSSASYSKLWDRFKLQNYPKVLEMTLPHSAEKHEKVILSLIVNNEKKRMQVLPSMIAHSKECPVSRENFVRQLLAASKAHFPKASPGKIKLIGSYADQLVSAQCTLVIAKAWGVEPVMHTKAGHDIPVDDPEWLLEQLI